MKDLKDLYSIINDYTELSGLVIIMQLKEDKLILSMRTDWTYEIDSLKLAIEFMTGMYNGAYLANN